MAGKVMKVGLVGCGIGREHLGEGYALNADRFEVAAICDTDRARRDAVADEFGVASRVDSIDDILGMDDIEVVDICTPPFLHFDHIRLALSAGKHVICEKPLVGSLAEIDTLAGLSEHSAGRLMPVFQSRFGDGVQQVRRLIETGICGKLYLATAETCWLRGARYYDVPWRGKLRTELGGTLLSHAIHTHDVLTYLVGPIRSLCGTTATRVNDIETEDCFSASGLLENGAPVALSGTLGSQFEFTRLYLAFENLTIESATDPYDYSSKPWRIVPANQTVRSSVDASLAGWKPLAPGFATQFRLFWDSLAEGKPLPVTLEDARRALALVAAVYRSQETQRQEMLA